MLILRTLLFGPAHGHAIEHASEEVLQVEHGSLYPALHRLVRLGFLSAKDGLSENNRKARYYSRTPKGRQRLRAEASKWERLACAIGRIMQPGGGTRVSDRR